MSRRSKNKQDFYKYSYIDIGGKDYKPTVPRKVPKVRRSYEQRDSHYFSDTYSVSLHYIERYIERVFGLDPSKYSNKSKVDLAIKLAKELPIGSGLTTEVVDKDIGIKSIIVEGKAITCLLIDSCGEYYGD